MSENANSSELAVEETASVESADDTKPESISPPKKADKKKMWVVIVAIIVVAALVGTALYVLIGDGGLKDLEAEMTPGTIPDVPAGDTQALSIVNVAYGGDDVSIDSEDLSYLWSVDPYNLGSFDYLAKANVNFIAGDEGGSGEIECVVTYKVDDEQEVSVTVSASVTVDPPFLESINIYPSSAVIAPDEEKPFGAKVFDSAGSEVTDASITWSVSGLDASDYTLNATTGPNVTFSASVVGNATLTATATDGIDPVSSSAFVEITSEAFTRTVDYLWYDMFNHPIGEHYTERWETYGIEHRITDTFPYLYTFEGSGEDNLWIYSFMRLDIAGRNMPELSMNENPQFLPYLGDARGGTATLDWELDYLTYADAEEKLGEVALLWYEGWYVKINGTTTLDEQAAKAVLGVSTSEEFENFDDWWATNGADVKSEWEVWIDSETQNDRLALWSVYGEPLNTVYFVLDAEKVGDEVIVTLDWISWGGDALMFSWLREAWMETEWWMEDMYLDVTIGPERADLDLNAAVEYSVYAYTTSSGEMCWVLEPLIADEFESDLSHPFSEYDAYADLERTIWAPGNGAYGEERTYEFTPSCWNLSANETLTFEWPAEEVLFFAHDIDELGTGTLVDNTLEIWASMTVEYAEPYDIPDVVTIDTEARQLVYEGPFDFWTWSKDQTDYDRLENEWNRLEILPYGLPWVEFIPESDEIRLDLEVEGLVGPYETGEEASFTVTVKDIDADETYTAYGGTITFESSSDGAAILPDDYTFVPADAGTHDFTVVFNTVDAGTHEATHILTVYDIDDSLISASVSGILVSEPERIDRFEVTFAGGDVIAGEPADITVTAYDQWDEVYEDYEGTVNFTSDDVGADLPDNYTFVPADTGTHDFEVTFATEGLNMVNVTDVDNTDASGEESVTVLEAARVDHFLLTGVSDPSPLDEQPETMTVTVYDQYDREFTEYEREVGFESNNSDVNLPSDTLFTLGDPDIEVTVEFLAVGNFTLYCNDTLDDTISGTLAVEVVASVFLDHFEVTGIEDMWEGNYSSVTVKAIDNTGGVYENYIGTIVFSSDPSSGVTLPTTDLTFALEDNGVKEWVDAVSFDEPDTYSVTVEDSVDDTKVGTQTGIFIDDLYADSLVLSAVPTEVTEDVSFSVTVTALHQYDEVFTEYVGTVTFTSSDGTAVLPGDYTFLPGDNGVHEFTDELSLSTLGSQTVIVTDTDDGTLTDTKAVNVIAVVEAWVQYKVYDMFEEPLGEWWGTRWEKYKEDVFLTTDDGNATQLFYVTGAPGIDPADYAQTLTYAPYRWNITGEMLPNANVHEPEFMPVLGSPVAGAEASVYIYFNYLSWEWWDDYWIPEWGWHPDWDSISGAIEPYPGSGMNEGYCTGVYYNVSMNRAAAEEWIGLPQSEGDVADWWSGSRSGYETEWNSFIDDEANDRLNIWCGWGEPYYSGGVIIELYEAGPDEVYMEIATFTWGYEVLMTRWLNETGISTHQPWYEDFEMVVDYGEDAIDIEMDAVAQWAMHCNKANESELLTGAPCAWVWEPLKIDYIDSEDVPGGEKPHSDYDPYADLTYQSWNCGDSRYGATDPALYDIYEQAPGNFSLPAYGTLVFELPDRADVLGYYGEAVDPQAPIDAWLYYDEIMGGSSTGGSFDAYNDLQYRGSMDLGWNNLGAADYYYHVVDKILTINGSFDWHDWRDEGAGVLWHGSPWIEFNVVESTMAAAASSVTPSVGLEASSSVPEVSNPAAVTSATSELVSLASMVSAVMLTITALAVGARRRDLA